MSSIRRKKELLKLGGESVNIQKISIQDETVVLTYQTDDLSKIEDASCQWVDALKAAKIVKSE